MTYSLWNTLLDGNSIPLRILAHCNHSTVDHVKSGLVMLEANFRRTVFENLYDFMSSQPQFNRAADCTAMYVSVLISRPFWFTIPCNQALNYKEVDFICETSLLESGPTSNVPNSTLIQPKILSNAAIYSLGCSQGWSLIEKICLFSLPLSDDDSRININQKCKIIGSTVLDLPSGAKLTNIFYTFLEVLSRHSNEKPIILLQSQSECIMFYQQPFPQLEYLLSDKWKQGDCSSALNGSHQLCGMKPKNITHREQTFACSHNLFQCLDGSCILNTYLCDGQSDCKESEDESHKQCAHICYDQLSGSWWPQHVCRDTCMPQQCACNNKAYFQCNKGGCVHLTLLCNHVVNCPRDASDEALCGYKLQDINVEFECNNGQLIDKSDFCDGQKHCWDGSDEDCFVDSLASHSFQCLHSFHKIPRRFVNDLMFDCPGNDSSDEELFEKMLNKTTTLEFKCPFPLTDVPCISGHPHCFPHDKTCVYLKDGQGNLMFCRNGEHLLGCDFFPCPYPYLKCNFSFCIPSSYTCDGVIDCPDGDDEFGCTNGITCSGMLKCKNGSCVHLENVCDGVVDCQVTADDESLCAFVKCPSGCICVGPMYECSSLSLTSVDALPAAASILVLPNNQIKVNHYLFNKFYRMQVLDISNNSISNLPLGHLKDGPFSRLNWLISLNLSYNKIEIIELGNFAGLQNVVFLFLKGNRIQTLKDFAFNGLSSLQSLNLSNQFINNIETFAFWGLSSLKSVDLSSNRISIFSHNVFSYWEVLHFVDFRNNPVKYISLLLFQSNARVEVLFVNTADWCCHVTAGICRTPSTSKETCLGILKSIFQRVSMLILLSLCVILNLAVIIYRTQSKGFLNDMFVLNLGTADLLCGLYLAVVLAGDVQMTYLSSYATTSEVWRTSRLCNIAMSLSLTSCLMSNTVLILRSFNVLFATKLPFRYHQSKTKTYFCVILSVLWIISVLFSISLGIQQRRPTNNMCLIYLPPADADGGYSYPPTLFFLGFVSISQGAVVMMDISSQQMITKAQHIIQKSHGNRISSHRLLLPSMVNASCALLKIAATLLILLQVIRMDDFVILTASWIISSSSVLNPVLYNMKYTI